MYRSPYASMFDVILNTEENFLICTLVFTTTLALILFTAIFNRFLLRLYLNRETDEYCAVYCGFWGVSRVSFTHKDVRMFPNATKFQCGYRLKNRPTWISPDEFRNIRDYHQLLRYAKKLRT